MRHLKLSKRTCVLTGCIVLLAMAPTSASAAEKAPLPDPSGLTLLDKGKAPRRLLALKLKPGAKGKVQSSSRSIVKGASNNDMAQPAMNVTMDWHIVGGNAKDGWNFKVKMDLPPFPEGMSRGDIPETVRFTGKAFPDGKNEFNTPDGFKRGAGMLVSMLATELGKNSVYLPSEPVGLGAKWKKEQTTNAMMMMTITTTNYEITRIDKKGFEATLTTEIVIPGDGPVSMNGKSSAKMVWHANQLFPAAMSTDLEMRTTTRTDGSADVTQVNTHIEHTSKLVR